MGMQDVLRFVYPPQCLTCEEQVTTDFGLCGACWRDTPFITGLVCDLCGTPLPGEEEEGGPGVHCDDCMGLARPWVQGRAALLYAGNARRLVLALKHGDRLDLARPAAAWLHRAARPMLSRAGKSGEAAMIVAPVPLHWTRLLRRRYNQSALLSGALARLARLDHCPDLLVRPRATRSQDGRDREARYENVAGALRVHPRRRARLMGARVLIVDDVMTSGATLAAAAEACLDAGAAEVRVLALARVTKDP